MLARLEQSHDLTLFIFSFGNIVHLFAFEDRAHTRVVFVNRERTIFSKDTNTRSCECTELIESSKHKTSDQPFSIIIFFSHRSLIARESSPSHYRRFIRALDHNLENMLILNRTFNQQGDDINKAYKKTIQHNLV